MPAAQSGDERGGKGEEEERHKRVKARWTILRSAILSGKTCDANDERAMAAVSINRFSGFQLLERKVIGASELAAVDPTVGALVSYGDDGIQYECVEYSLDAPPSRTESSPQTAHGADAGRSALRIRTRQHIQRPLHQQKVSLDTLLSHRHYGVDNTGQVRVWDSESTLAYYLTKGDASCIESIAPSAEGVSDDCGSEYASSSLLDALISLAGERNELRVVELGSGSAGLAGLALAVLSLGDFTYGKTVHVTLTDGHPHAVASNRACSLLTSRLYGEWAPSNITCQQLLWNDGDEGVSQCAQMTRSGAQPFDLCLASDCTHFQEFHAALAATIGRLLAVEGVCIMCQPKRSDSLPRFIAVLNAMNSEQKLFDIKLQREDYDERLWTLHRQQMEKGHTEDKGNCLDAGAYDPMIHYPLLLILKKIREYKEEIHTAAAVNHVRNRQ